MTVPGTGLSYKRDQVGTLACPRKQHRGTQGRGKASITLDVRGVAGGSLCSCSRCRMAVVTARAWKCLLIRAEASVPHRPPGRAPPASSGRSWLRALIRPAPLRRQAHPGGAVREQEAKPACGSHIPGERETWTLHTVVRREHRAEWSGEWGVGSACRVGGWPGHPWCSRLDVRVDTVGRWSQAGERPLGLSGPGSSGGSLQAAWAFPLGDTGAGGGF